MKKGNIKKGTKVIILRDVRRIKNKRNGQEAIFIGYENKEVWILFSAKGEAVRESYELPAGHIEWNPDEEKFSGKRCGIKSLNPIFRFGDGTEINGGQCCWAPKNQKIKKRTLDEFNDLMKKAQEK